ncbi:vacuolar membrane-associated protein iml1 [Coniosporium apollinis]|uniref:Vacuolar membrane-associated protein IML1 n=1 Tax=Coniosporium apollinis TaxID=61459 RepID=A0ABQ9NUL0_9PEZI|nr:vacuolar membrane-associated protein iml1 [Coniosporium apollinis]
MKISCSLWTHQDGAFPHDAVFNASAFGEIGLQSGDLVGLLHSGSGQRHLVVVHEITPEQKSKYPGLQISLSESAAKAYDLRNRSTIEVTAANIEDNSASHVELTFRDEYLSRADMWRLAASELSQRALYRGQKILFMGTIKATVRNIYINGRVEASAYFSATTKPIFRSESARYVLFVQMSTEMWQYATGQSGDLLHEKVIRFLEDLFLRWESMNARHLVTIVLFTRVTHDSEEVSPGGSLLHNLRNGATKHKDFYRVIVNEMQSVAWIEILNTLKREFRYFGRSVLVDSNVLLDCYDETDQPPSSDQGLGNSSAAPKPLIRGKITTAPEGNILEAITLASSQFSHDYIDRDLVRTGISVVVITPGNGIFHVSYNMLKHITDILVGNGIGIDLVCMSPLSLHSTPLFVFREPCTVDSAAEVAPSSIDNNTPRQKQPNFGHLSSSATSTASSSRTITKDSATEHVDNAMMDSSKRASSNSPSPSANITSFGREICAVPHWIDVGYWDEPVDRQAHGHTARSRNFAGRDEFSPQVRLYDLEMTGIMENQMSDISIQYMIEQCQDFRAGCSPRDDRTKAQTYLRDDWLKRHDRDIFKNLQDTPPAPDNARRKQPEVQQDARAAGRSSALSLLSVQSTLTRSLSNSTQPDRTTKHTKNARTEAYPMSKGLEEARSRLPRSPMAALAASDRADFTQKLDLLARKPSDRATGFPGLISGREHERDGHDGDATSSNANRNTTTERPNRTSRQISFGFFGFGSKASASTALSMGGTQSATALRGSKVGGKSGKQDSLNQVRASLIRKVSHSATIASDPVAPEHHSDKIKDETVSVKDEPESVEPDEISVPSQAPGATSSKKLTIPSGLQNKTLLGSRDVAAGDGTQAIPQTVLPLTSLLPWLEIINPCNPTKNDATGNGLWRRWHHIYPNTPLLTEMKWKSLCCPAAIPLTNEDFPTAKELATEFSESPYRVMPCEEEEYDESPSRRDRLVKELIAARLTHGFQIVVGKKVLEISGVQQAQISNVFDDRFMTGDGATVFLTLGNTIHQIICIGKKEVEVRRFCRKPIAALASSNDRIVSSDYRPWIRTAHATHFSVEFLTLGSPSNELNWNAVDSFLAGFDNQFSEALRFWRARFVLIPVDVPATGRRMLPVGPQLSAEEMRLEGIRKLTQLWQQRRHLPSQEQHFQANTRKIKDLNPLAIEYQTRDPSAVVAAGINSSILAGNDPAEFATQIFSENEPYKTSSIDLKKLAQDIQSTKDIPLEDRRWHLKLHYNCFIGTDLTSWLLRNFSDVQTREEAVELGNSLMKQGLFQHVQGKHPFLDGNFFYTIAFDYRTPRAEGRTGWFGTRRGDKSVPSTPMTEPSKHASGTSRERSRPKTGNSSSTESSDKTPTKVPAPKRKVLLSRSMRYDVDHRKKSYRPEIITLHYDRLHNPGNCFHIRIDWLNVTPKLIEDCIVTWSTTVEKYGLKLVELPIAEATSTSVAHPFRAASYIRLAVPPPELQPQQYFDATHFAPVTQADKFAYHKALLKKLDFVLDMESADSFPPDVDVTYSWGKPDYRYTQFIHKSGLVLAQINDDGVFALIANRLCVNRVAASRVDTTKFDRLSGFEGAAGPPPPVLYAMQNGRYMYCNPEHIQAPPSGAAEPKHITAESIKDDFEKFCKDERSLKKFYAEVFAKVAGSPSPSPHNTPVLDSSIPSIRLPPNINIPGLRDPSPLGQTGYTAS